jgi:catechol-2,3-dioxygenase
VSIQARDVHTNLIARDWRSLARFYEDVFACVPVPPERDYAGDDLDGEEVEWCYVADPEGNGIELQTWL